jgi:nitrate/TMAO reductase-like tetraheme cytochrome c subunit
MPVRQPSRRWGLLWTATACAVIIGSAAAAFQGEAKQADPKKDADLPAEIAKLPFEIRDGYRRFIKRCTTCHDQKRVVEARKSLFEWQGVIGTMAPEEKDEYLTFLAKCEDCHGIGLMYKDKKPMKEWPAIIHRMAGKNQAKISPEDEKKVMRYIERMYPDVFGVE